MRSALAKEFSDRSLEDWLIDMPDPRALAELCSTLRATAGGGAATALDAKSIGTVAAYLSGGERTESELARLVADGDLRRQVASVARVLAVSEPESGSGRERWFGRRWVGVAAVLAACAVGVLVAPRLLDDLDGDVQHRSATITVADVHVLGPEGEVAAPPRIRWRPVLGADLYQVEVTDARGQMVFLGTTQETELQVSADALDEGVPYFYRVRARVGASRWIASEFQEFVLR